MGKKYDDDDNLTEEMMLDIWDGLKEEPCSRKDGYPAKKQKKVKKQKTQESKGKFYRLVGLVEGKVMYMPEKNDVPAVSENQAMYFICFDLKKKSKNGRSLIRPGFKKIWNSWDKYVNHNGPKEYWVEEVKEEDEKVMKKELNMKDWQKYEAVEAECFGKNLYPSKGKGMTIVISSGYMSLHLSLKNKYAVSIVDDTEWRENNGESISVTYEIDEDTAGYLNFEVFTGINIFTKCKMPENFGYYVTGVREALQAAGIIEKEEEQEMEEKKMDLDQLVDAANKAAEAEVITETQQVEENIKKEEEINMANEESKKIEVAKEVEQQAQEQEQPVIIENAIPVATITLETIANNMKQLSVALMPQDEKKGTIDAVRVTDGEFETIGSYVISGGYSFPLFRVTSKWFKKTTLSVKRTVDTNARTIRFSGSKNYMSLLKLMFSDEEIEAAKVQEISRRFPPICQRSESKGVEKNIEVSVTLPDGSNLKLDGWVQREHRPLYMENADRTTTVRWDFGKGYKSPSVKHNGKMLRENHDGVSGSPEDAKIFMAIKEAIEDKLNKG